MNRYLQRFRLGSVLLLLDESENKNNSPSPCFDFWNGKKTKKWWWLAGDSVFLSESSGIRRLLEILEIDAIPKCL
jgi:hypothetical protein